MELGVEGSQLAISHYHRVALERASRNSSPFLRTPDKYRKPGREHMRDVSDEVIFDIVGRNVEASLRAVGSKHPVTEETEIYGKGSPLSSIELVALIVDIEDDIVAVLGSDISLVDERAMSQTRSPFKDVSSMCDYVSKLLVEGE